MRYFQELTNLEMMEQFIDNTKLSLIYVSKTNCSICHALLPQVQKLMQKYPRMELGQINVDTVREVAGQWSLFTAPVLLLFLDGKEISRDARIVHMDLFEQKLDKIYINVVGS